MKRTINNLLHSNFSHTLGHYLRYTILVAFSFSIFAFVPPSSHRVNAQSSHLTPSSSHLVSLALNTVKKTVKRAPKTVPVVTTPSVVVPVTPVFNANDPSTWPTCPAGDIVRADNGQCAVPAISVPIILSSPIDPGTHDALMAAAGIAPSDFGYVDWTVTVESGWNPNSVNPTSGACNLGQELPCGKSGCSLADVVCELQWMNSYVIGRYGSWAAEVAFHLEYGYY
jgi:hypothetical protein